VKETNPTEFQIISPGQRKNGINSGGGVYSVQGESAAVVTEWVQFIRDEIQGSLTRNVAASSSFKSSSKQMGNATSPTFRTLTPEQLQRVHIHNPTCADCNATNPDWVSLNLCICICIQCSGVHRQLGTHISKVRSLTLDIWSENVISLLYLIGNERANKVWEASVQESDAGVLKPTQFSSRQEREGFIRHKYVQGSFIKSTYSDIRVALLSSAKKGDYLRAYSLLATCSQRCAENSGGGEENDSGASFVLNSCVSDADNKTALHFAVEGFYNENLDSMQLCTDRSHSKYKLLIELLCLWGANSRELLDDKAQSAFSMAVALHCDEVVHIMDQYS
jgi:hypothetical protein